MYKKFFSTLSFQLIFVSFMIHIGLYFLDPTRSYFGSELGQGLKDLFVFRLSSPFRFFGLSFLLSLFYHESFLHLFLNLGFLLFLGNVVENSFGKGRYLLYVILGHILTLSFTFLSSLLLKNVVPYSMSGLSLVNISLFSAYLLHRQKFFLFGLYGLVILYSSFQTNLKIIDPHFSAVLVSSLLYFSLFRQKGQVSKVAHNF